MPKGPTDGPWSRTGPAARFFPAAIYDEYAMRGESENRNKELKVELHAGRLSDHRFMANFFRLYLHAAALEPAGAVAARGRRDRPDIRRTGRAGGVADAKRSTNRRAGSSSTSAASAIPLGEGFACTWRTRLIKVAAEVITRARRVIVRLSGSWPHLDQLLKVSQAVIQVRVGSSSP